MKKILLISFEYPIGKAYCGGVGQIVKQCRETLLNLGYETYVLISSEFQKKHPVKLLFPDGSLGRYPNFRTFQRQHDWHEFNYIIQHFVNWAKDFKKLKSYKGRKPKIIYHFHSILRREKESGFKTLNHFLLNQERMIEIADKIICPSRYEYDNFIRYFPYFSQKVTLIENTVENLPFDKDITENIKRRYVIKKQDIVSIYVGRLERIKGADILVRDIPKVLSRYTNLKIFIIGKALEKSIYKRLKMVQKKFPHQLFYIKYLKKSMLFQYYYLSDIYINTSLSESFSLSTHESALCNNTLLLNRLSVFEKFKDAALFFSSQDGNGDSFIYQFEKLVKSSYLRKKLSKKSNEIAKDFVTKERLKERLSQIL